MSLPRLVWGAVLGVALIIACSGADRLPPLGESANNGGNAGQGAGASAGAGLDGGVVFDGFDFDANCGYQAVNARQEPARIHVVLDRSGSMADVVGSTTKYTAARAALIKLVERVGWRSEIGATLFPSKNGNVCSAGTEVFAMRPGDPRSFLDEGKQGPVTAKFAQALSTNPVGGTPTGKTLAALVPRLSGLGKNTYVLLATDGGPNCNEDATCEASACIPNIEGLSGCAPSLNCCDPAVDPKFVTTNCLDSDATLSAVLALAQAGIKTIVIGIPGSAEYSTLLDVLAVAGGAPREGDTRYYRVDDLNDLEGVLLKIGSEITVSCDLSLDEPPHDPDEVNVYFDETVVPSGEPDGWVWTGPTSLSLRGKSCETMLSGAVKLVQVVVGCPTQFVK